MADGELRRYRFPGGTCSMPALAIDETIAHAFAVEAAIFASPRYQAHATWMCALLGFLFGHPPPCLSLPPPVSGMQWPMVSCDPCSEDRTLP